MCRHGKSIVMPLTCMARRRAAATSTSSIPAQSHAAAAPPPAGTHKVSTIPGISRHFYIYPDIYCQMMVNGELSHVKVTKMILTLTCPPSAGVTAENLTYVT